MKGRDGEEEKGVSCKPAPPRPLPNSSNGSSPLPPPPQPYLPISGASYSPVNRNSSKHYMTVAYWSVSIPPALPRAGGESGDWSGTGLNAEKSGFVLSNTGRKDWKVVECK
ncbi:predicted protein [Histoplasma capsulatum H143]|uniref:Uncharacterized protein n=1 Tax=Ajellomyces capsulatus (strain H143) TaxID=544712 RepID=C6HRJ1_AJECH|nr:predicted protein [Histoplasma capsulatum H143]